MNPYDAMIARIEAAAQAVSLRGAMPEGGHHEWDEHFFDEDEPDLEAPPVAMNQLDQKLLEFIWGGGGLNRFFSAMERLLLVTWCTRRELMGAATRQTDIAAICGRTRAHVQNQIELLFPDYRTAGMKSDTARSTYEGAQIVAWKKRAKDIARRKEAVHQQ